MFSCFLSSINQIRWDRFDHAIEDSLSGAREPSLGKASKVRTFLEQLFKKTLMKLFRFMFILKIGGLITYIFHFCSSFHLRFSIVMSQQIFSLICIIFVMFIFCLI